MKTINFGQAIGVFEGGGVRGSAFAGAIQELGMSKVNLIGNVGTSAGSIAATLVSAGFDADEITNALKVNFKTFLADADSPNGFKAKALNAISSGIKSKVGKMHYGMGLHSSMKIQSWLEELLKGKLKISSSQAFVKFKDLPKPLAIIATDVNSGTYKIWSTKKTPEDSVAFAVRCSSTIPFFFQPVPGDNTIYVDGGIISNLPLFLIDELELEDDIPALCFRLIQNIQTQKKSETGYQLGENLIDCILNSQSKIQFELSTNFQLIDINTDDIQATDFDINDEKINKLIGNGKEAVINFIKNEQSLIDNQTKNKTIYGYREGLLEKTAALINESSESIDIISGDLSWLKELHITLLSAARRGIRIRVICDKEISDSPELNLAIEAVESLGASITKKREPNLIKGTLIDINTEQAKMIAIEEKPITHGRVFGLPYDTGFISLITDKINSTWIGECQTSTITPTLLAIKEKKLVEALKSKISIYRNLNINYTTVEVDKLLPLSRYLERLKYERVKELNNILTEEGLPNAAYIENCPWSITPPVIEKIRSGKLIIIDGTHRVYHARENNRKEIKVLLVENHDSNLPSQPIKWDNVKLKTRKEPRELRYEEYKPEYFREISKAFLKLK